MHMLAYLLTEQYVGLDQTIYVFFKLLVYAHSSVVYRPLGSSFSFRGGMGKSLEVALHPFLPNFFFFFFFLWFVFYLGVNTCSSWQMMSFVFVLPI